MANEAQTGGARSAYRWVVLTVFFLLTVVIAIQWLTFAPVERAVRLAYGVTALQVDLLSVMFMVVFLFVCLPASFIIDRYGIRWGVGVGAVLTGVFSLLKGIFAPSYAVMVVCQIGLGVAQPFILNAATAVAAKWFPPQERATAVGLATLAQFAGFIIVNVATPYLVQPVGASYDLQGMLMTYGIASVAVAVAFLLLMREQPAVAVSPDASAERLLSRQGFRHLFRQRDMLHLLVLFFIGLGIFNAITTCIDQICEGKGLTSAQSGMIMGAMFIAGIVGALIMPPLSDRLRKRKPFLVGAIVLIVPGLLGATLAHSFGWMLASSAMMGFFLLGAAGPIGFQYGAEVCYPAPESLSQGIVLLAGQISGILFVVGMNVVGMTTSMVIFVFLALANIVVAVRLRESPIAARRPAV